MQLKSLLILTLTFICSSFSNQLIADEDQAWVKQADALIEKLDAPSQEDRESAQKALSELKLTALPYLKTKLNNEYRAEVSTRLEEAILLLKLKNRAKQSTSNGLAFYLEADRDNISYEHALNLSIYIYNAGKHDTCLPMGYGQNYYMTGQYLKPQVMKDNKLINCSHVNVNMFSKIIMPPSSAYIKAGKWVKYTTRLQLAKVSPENTKKYGLYVLKVNQWQGFNLHNAEKVTLSIDFSQGQQHRYGLQDNSQDAPLWQGHVKTNKVEITIK